MKVLAEQILSAISADRFLVDAMGCSCSKHSASEPQHAHGLPTLLTAVPARGRKPLKSRGAGAVDVSCHASEGSKWHSELLAVSTDLKEKLQDPQFVATRCDLDGSGDLDPHELRQAARVYGVDPGPGDGSAELMAGQRMSKESFADMVALRSQGRPPIRALDRYGYWVGGLSRLTLCKVDSKWCALWEKHDKVSCLAILIFYMFMFDVVCAMFSSCQVPTCGTV